MEGTSLEVASSSKGGLWVAEPHGYWMSGGGQVRRFDQGHWSSDLDPTPWALNSSRSQPTCLLEDRSGRLWFGTMWGGVHFSDANGHWNRLSNQGPFSQGLITSLFEGKEGAIWVGTVGDGLYRVTPRPVRMLSLPAPSEENLITASCAARNGAIWAGTDGAGLFRFENGALQPFSMADGLTNQHVCSILEDNQTNLWVGTWGGLFQLNPGERHFKAVSDLPILRGQVLALFADHSGDLWIGTAFGLARGHGGHYSIYAMHKDGGYSDIRSIAEDRAGNLWIGTVGQGIFRMRNGEVTHVENYSAPDARSVFCDSRGDLWVGSMGSGLFRLRNGGFNAFTSSDGLPCDSIISMVEDDAGNLWMSSDNGIFGLRLRSIEDYVPGRSPPLLCLRASLPEGLANRACSGSGQPVCARTGDGRLWFPNMRGLAVFDPRMISVERPAPGVFVESVLADGKELSILKQGELQAASHVRRYEFNYTAPNLISPQSLRFRHKLEGMDHDWVEARMQRVAYYSQLPAGHYQFRVMTGGADGQWHEGTAIKLRVVPRLWEIRSVQILAGVFLATAAVAGLAALSRRRLQRRFELFQMQHAVEQERSRIARDIHDDLGASLTEIALMSELNESELENPGSVKPQLDRIAAKARSVVQMLNEIVWAINPRNDNLPKLLDYLCTFSEEFCESAGVRCWHEVQTGLPEIRLTVEFRHNLFLAVKEAINNSLKHSGATEIWLRARVSEYELRIVVQDNGCGFGSEDETKGNGLENLRVRMRQIGGRVDIESLPGKGTQVAFMAGLPIDNIQPEKEPDERRN
jgi:signal transduction histidine kinase/streptogramin lyase